MKDLHAGAFRFRTEVFPELEPMFEALAHGQRPVALFLTCADSRIDPSLITQSAPGTLFVVRNAGNVVPPEAAGGVGATVEYALEALDVQHIVVCGHYGCGAMQALLEPDKTAALPLTRAWLAHTGEVAEHIVRNIAALEHRDLHDVAVETNVRLQLKHLRQHPSVVRRPRLRLHGWVYDMSSGSIRAWQRKKQVWAELGADRTR